MLGDEMFALAQKIYPHRRSLTGNGVRDTLCDLREFLPNLQIHEVPSGMQVFDWTVPPEWSVREAFIENVDTGERIIDWQNNALHLVGYSVPVDKVISFKELDEHLHSRPSLPDAIPYVTSYYARTWGFCLTHCKRQHLDPQAQYRVYIDSVLDENGSLTYADLMISGTEQGEVLLSTYICHPPMGNNETSGPVVTAFLADWIAQAPRRLTYRFVFVPETIGSLVYLSQHLEYLKTHVIAGFVVTCVGDDHTFSYMPSRKGATLADRVALQTLINHNERFDQYAWHDRGSDERQYCAPGVDLPVCSVMRSKYGTYPEYHTSFDDMSFISADGLFGAFTVLSDCIEMIEANTTVRMTCLGEPMLGKRGLYPNVSTHESATFVQDMMDAISMLDGTMDLLSVSEVTGVPFKECIRIARLMIQHGLAEEI